jgi:predicted N-acetyltransferase YhbS
VTDHSIFKRSAFGHPYFGPITSAIREFELARLVHLSQQAPRRTFDLVAILDGKAVGACTIHVGKAAAGLHDVGVVEPYRNRGIGRALVTEACRLARTKKSNVAVLISSGMGESVYRAVGFREVCKMAFWYQAFR